MTDSLEPCLNRACIFIKGISCEILEADVRRELQVMYTNTRLNPPIVLPRDNRVPNGKLLGTAYCNYSTSEEAAEALQKWRFRIKIGGASVRMMLAVHLDGKDEVFGPRGNRFMIQVGNLSSEVEDSTLHDRFEQYGEIYTCWTQVDTYGQTSGAVQFIEEASVNLAITRANNTALQGYGTIITVQKYQSYRVDPTPAPQIIPQVSSTTDFPSLGGPPPPPPPKKVFKPVQPSARLLAPAGLGSGSESASRPGSGSGSASASGSGSATMSQLLQAKLSKPSGSGYRPDESANVFPSLQQQQQQEESDDMEELTSATAQALREIEQEQQRMSQKNQRGSSLIVPHIQSEFPAALHLQPTPAVPILGLNSALPEDRAAVIQRLREQGRLQRLLQAQLEAERLNQSQEDDSQPTFPPPPAIPFSTSVIPSTEPTPEQIRATQAARERQRIRQEQQEALQHAQHQKEQKQQQLQLQQLQQQQKQKPQQLQQQQLQQQQQQRTTLTPTIPLFAAAVPQAEANPQDSSRQEDYSQRRKEPSLRLFQERLQQQSRQVQQQQQQVQQVQQGLTPSSTSDFHSSDSYSEYPLLAAAFSAPSMAEFHATLSSEQRAQLTREMSVHSDMNTQQEARTSRHGEVLRHRQAAVELNRTLQFEQFQRDQSSLQEQTVPTHPSSQVWEYEGGEIRLQSQPLPTDRPTSASSGISVTHILRSNEPATQVSHRSNSAESLGIDSTRYDDASILPIAAEDIDEDAHGGWAGSRFHTIYSNHGSESGSGSGSRPASQLGEDSRAPLTPSATKHAGTALDHLSNVRGLSRSAGGAAASSSAALGVPASYNPTPYRPVAAYAPLLHRPRGSSTSTVPSTATTAATADANTLGSNLSNNTNSIFHTIGNTTSSASLLSTRERESASIPSSLIPLQALPADYSALPHHYTQSLTEVDADHELPHISVSSAESIFRNLEPEDDHSQIETGIPSSNTTNIATASRLDYAEASQHSQPRTQSSILPALEPLPDAFFGSRPGSGVYESLEPSGPPSQRTSAQAQERRGNLQQNLREAMSQFESMHLALCCPITQELLVDPVIADDGHTYERSAIEAWLAQRDTSPCTNEQLASKTLVANILVRALIQSHFI